jgi:hypothetical protein
MCKFLAVSFYCVVARPNVLDVGRNQRLLTISADSFFESPFICKLYKYIQKMV